MKKFNILFATIIVSLLIGFSNSYSQSIFLLDYINEVQAQSNMSMKSYATLKNFSSNTIEIGLKIIKLSVTEGHVVTHCFGGNCYPPASEDITISPGTLTLEPNEESTEGDFDVELSPNGIDGESTVKLVFFVVGNESDFAEYEVKFIAGDYDDKDIEIIEANTYINGDDENTSYKSFATIKNITDHSVEIGLKIIKLSVTEGHIVTHCFGGNCYPPSVNDTSISPGTLTLEPNEESAEGDFDVELSPNGMPGSSKVKLVFFIVGNEENNDDYEVEFKISGSSVTENNYELNCCSYPNPAKNIVNFDLSDMTGNIQIKIFDAQSMLVSDLSVSNPISTYSVNCSAYSQGIYNYIILKDGRKIKNGRFAIVR